MIRRSFRIGLRLGILAGIAFAILKIVQARRPSDAAVTPARSDAWPPVVPPPAPPPPPPAPPPPPPAAEPVAKAAPIQKAAPVKKAAAAKKTRPPKKAATKKAAAPKKTAPVQRGWVTPQGQVCPLSHPIKAKLASKIYHLPGMLNYTRTRADRCYASEAAAKRDGLSAAKR